MPLVLAGREDEGAGEVLALDALGTRRNRLQGAQVVVPPGVVGVPRRGPRVAKGGPGRLARLRPAVSETEAEGRLAGAGGGQRRGLDEVDVLGVAAVGERGAGDEGAGDRVVLVDGVQRVPGAPAPVVVAAVAERRVVVDPEGVGAAVEGLEPGVNDHRAPGGIGDDLLGDPVPALAVGAHLGEPQASFVGTRRHGAHVDRLHVGGRPVADGQVQRPHTRRGQVGVEDLAEPATAQGEPHPALARPGRPEAGLVRLGPALLALGLRRRVRRFRTCHGGYGQRSCRHREDETDHPRTSLHGAVSTRVTPSQPSLDVIAEAAGHPASW